MAPAISRGGASCARSRLCRDVALAVPREVREINHRNDLERQTSLPALLGGQRLFRQRANRSRTIWMVARVTARVAFLTGWRSRSPTMAARTTAGYPARSTISQSMALTDIPSRQPCARSRRSSSSRSLNGAAQETPSIGDRIYFASHTGRLGEPWPRMSGDQSRRRQRQRC